MKLLRSQLLLALSLLGLVVQMPMHAAGIAYKPAALMAAASTAAAVLSNGVISIADSIKKERLFELSKQLEKISLECTILNSENASLKREADHFRAYIKDIKANGPSLVKVISFCAVAAGILGFICLSNKKAEIAAQPITDKEELTIKA